MPRGGDARIFGHECQIGGRAFGFCSKNCLGFLESARAAKCGGQTGEALIVIGELLEDGAPARRGAGPVPTGTGGIGVSFQNTAIIGEYTDGGRKQHFGIVGATQLEQCLCSSTVGDREVGKPGLELIPALEGERPARTVARFHCRRHEKVGLIRDLFNGRGLLRSRGARDYILVRWAEDPFKNTLRDG